MRVVDRGKLLEVLGRIAERYPEVRLMYLFGSYAEGRAMPASDIDVALVVSGRGVIPSIMAELAGELGVPEERISVVDLEYAQPTLVAAILGRGVKIVDRSGWVQRLLSKIEPEVQELNELGEAHFAKWLEGNPLDPRVVWRIVAQILEDVNDLKGYLGRGLEAVTSDRTLRKAFERTLQTAIEGCIDLLRHLVSGLNLGVAEYYRDYVEIPKSRGIISGEVAEKLLELIPTRHALVHRYREISYERLWRDAQIVAEIAPKLVEEVRKYLKTLKSP